MTRHALTRVNVITGDREGTVLTDRAVIIDGTTIVDVVSTDQLPSGIQTTNLKGHFVLPGLINAHAHLFSDGKPLPSISESPLIGRLVSAVIHGPIGRRLLRTRTRTNALTQLHTGVTTVRSLGDFGDEVLKIRDEINEGKTTGPTLLASGPLLAATGGHGAPDIALVADDPWGGSRQCAAQYRYGCRCHQDCRHWRRDRCSFPGRGRTSAVDHRRDVSHLRRST